MPPSCTIRTLRLFTCGAAEHRSGSICWLPLAQEPPHARAPLVQKPCAHMLMMVQMNACMHVHGSTNSCTFEYACMHVSC